MFLRRKRKIVDGNSYEYWTLCESVRTDRGPRQRIVANMGKLTPREARAASVEWKDLEALLEGKAARPARQMNLGEQEADGQADEQHSVATCRGSPTAACRPTLMMDKPGD